MLNDERFPTPVANGHERHRNWQYFNLELRNASEVFGAGMVIPRMVFSGAATNVDSENSEEEQGEIVTAAASICIASGTEAEEEWTRVEEKKLFGIPAVPWKRRLSKKWLDVRTECAEARKRESWTSSNRINAFS